MIVMNVKCLLFGSEWVRQCVDRAPVPVGQIRPPRSRVRREVRPPPPRVKETRVLVYRLLGFLEDKTPKMDNTIGIIFKFIEIYVMYNRYLGNTIV